MEVILFARPFVQEYRQVVSLLSQGGYQASLKWGPALSPRPHPLAVAVLDPKTGDALLSKALVVFYRLPIPISSPVNL